MKINIKKNFNKFLIAGSSFLVAVPAFAATVCTTGAQIQDLQSFLSCFILENMKKIVPVLILVALVIFLSGVVRFVTSGDNEEKRQAGRQVMVYGIIILFVMISTWGIVGLISGSFFPGTSISLPDALPKLQTN